MRSRILLAGCVAVVTAIAWFSSARPNAEPKSWDKLDEGIYRTKTAPHSYALVSGDKAILIDATAPPDTLAELGVKEVHAVYLTHHHRDTAACAAEYRKKGWRVRAPKESAEWLTPENVAKFWKDSIPLTNSRTAYFVLPVGVEGI
jgi:glyoxylase-like metal-dependent hydrolase (beta-lactamase superfamily II)